LTPRTTRAAAAIATAVVALTALAGCGGDDPYCAAVKDNLAPLKTFGDKKTDAGYAGYAKAVRAIATNAPDTVKKDWSKLGSVTDGVIKAQKRAGIKLEDMSDPAKVEKLSSDDLTTLNKAYSTFVDTAEQRKAIVDNVEETCDISLQPDKEK
jgi:hypothetical protein